MSESGFDPNRRACLVGLGAVALGAALFPTDAEAKAKPLPPRRLKMFNTHTLESIDVVYWRNGKYDPKSLKRLNVFLRDHYSNQVARMDPRVLDVLYGVQTTLKSKEAFRIISGYRAPATNAALRAESEAVAFHSYHMRGMAIDLALPDRRVTAIAQCASAMKCGGVGTYHQSGFVHLDVGPIRYWYA